MKFPKGRVFGAPPVQPIRQFATVTSSRRGIQKILTPAPPPIFDAPVPTPPTEQITYPDVFDVTTGFYNATFIDVHNLPKSDACPSGVTVVKPKSKKKRYENSVCPLWTLTIV
jgi:hypothetical protein